MIGLYKAIRDFREEKLTSFRAFAELCITRQIITAIKTATRQKHIPLNSYVSLNKPIYDEESDRTLLDVITEGLGSEPGGSAHQPGGRFGHRRAHRQDAVGAGKAGAASGTSRARATRRSRRRCAGTSSPSTTRCSASSASCRRCWHGVRRGRNPLRKAFRRGRKPCEPSACGRACARSGMQPAAVNAALRMAWLNESEKTMVPRTPERVVFDGLAQSALPFQAGVAFLTCKIEKFLLTKTRFFQYNGSPYRRRVCCVFHAAMGGRAGVAQWQSSSFPS